MKYKCARCGKATGRFGRWIHTYFTWNWWSVPRWMITGKPGLHCWGDAKGSGVLSPGVDGGKFGNAAKG